MSLRWKVLEPGRLVLRLNRSLMMKAVLGFALAAAPLSSASANGMCLRGINLAGAEFGDLPGVFGQTYIYPSKETVAYFAEKGFTTVRLPFLWERLQPKLDKPFAKKELARLKESVRHMRSLGLVVILDPHNYARYNGETVGSKAVSNRSFADLWKRLAQQFGDDSGIIFGLMNEPHTMPAPQWLDAANVAIAAIRDVSRANLILVPGTAWTGAHSWFGDWYGGANAATMLGVKDPANNYAYEFHQYFDDDFSGTLDNCNRASEAIAGVGKVAQWLRENGKRGFLGEFGVTRDAACITAVEQMTDALDRDSDVWIGWAYWAAGDMWPETEALNIQPTINGDRPQLAGLQRAIESPKAALGCTGLPQ